MGVLKKLFGRNRSKKAVQEDYASAGTAEEQGNRQGDTPADTAAAAVEAVAERHSSTPVPAHRTPPATDEEIELTVPRRRMLPPHCRTSKASSATRASADNMRQQPDSPMTGPTNTAACSPNALKPSLHPDYCTAAAPQQPGTAQAPEQVDIEAAQQMEQSEISVAEPSDQETHNERKHTPAGPWEPPTRPLSPPSTATSISHSSRRYSDTLPRTLQPLRPQHRSLPLPTPQSPQSQPLDELLASSTSLSPSVLEASEAASATNSTCTPGTPGGTPRTGRSLQQGLGRGAPPGQTAVRQSASGKLPVFLLLLQQTLDVKVFAEFRRPSRSQSMSSRVLTRQKVTVACIDTLVAAIKLCSLAEAGDTLCHSATALGGDAQTSADQMLRVLKSVRPRLKGQRSRAKLYAEVSLTLGDVWASLDIIDAIAIKPLIRCLRKASSPAAQREAAGVLEQLAACALVTYNSTTLPLLELLKTNNTELRQVAVRTLSSYVTTYSFKLQHASSIVEDLITAMQHNALSHQQRKATELQADLHDPFTGADFARALLEGGAMDLLLALLQDPGMRSCHAHAARLITFTIMTERRGGATEQAALDPTALAAHLHTLQAAAPPSVAPNSPTSISQAAPSSTWGVRPDTPGSDYRDGRTQLGGPGPPLQPDEGAREHGALRQSPLNASQLVGLLGGISAARIKRQDIKLVLRILEEVTALPDMRSSLLLAGAGPVLRDLAQPGNCFATEAARILCKLQADGEITSTGSLSSNATTSSSSTSIGALAGGAAE